MDIEFTSQSQLIACLEAGLAYLDLNGKHLAAAYLAQTIEVLGAELNLPESETKTQ